MAAKIFQFVVWAIVLIFVSDFVYSAFNQGRHLNQAFKRHWRKRSGGSHPED